MASLDQIESAFMKAHNAGDTGAASTLAAEIKRLRASAQTERRAALVAKRDATDRQLEEMKPGKLASFVMGAVDTGSLGFQDEINAGIDASLGLNKYNQSLAANRQQAKVAEEANPWSYMGGQVAGALPQAALAAPASGAALVPRMATASLAGGAQGGIYGFGSGEGGAADRSRNAVNSAAWGAALGPAAELAGAGAGKAVQKLTAQKPVIPTTANIKAASKSAFAAADRIGLAVKPQAFGNMIDDVYRSAAKKGFFAPNHPQLANALGEVEKFRGSPITLDEIMGLRKNIKSAYSPANPDQNRLMGLVVEKFDDYLQNMPPSQVMSGNPQAATKTLQKARADWARFRKAETIDNIFQNALNAEGANYSMANAATSIRQQLRALAKDDFRNAKYFSPPERKMILQTIRGGKVENFLRQWGKFGKGPVGLGSSGAIGTAASFLLGPLGGLAVSGTLAGGGAVARPIARRLGVNSVNALNEAIRSGGPVASTSRYMLPVQQGVSSLLRPQAGILGETIGSQLPVLKREPAPLGSR